jgi:hypothetical protein
MVCFDIECLLHFFFDSLIGDSDDRVPARSSPDSDIMMFDSHDGISVHGPGPAAPPRLRFDDLRVTLSLSGPATDWQAQAERH